MQSPRPEDRRLHPRHPFVVRVEYPGRHEYLSDWTENVSAGGVFLRTDQVFALGDRVTVAMSFPGLLEPVQIEGVVTWMRPEHGTQPQGVGLRVDLESHRRKLAELALLVGESERAAGSAHATRSYAVLIVEDNANIAELYQRVLARVGELSSGGVRTFMAVNGFEALETLRRETIDLVLSDLYMPVMDGVALVQQMRADARLAGVPIVLITSGGDDERARAERAGVTGFMRKPVQFAQLLSTVVALLRLRS